MKLDTRAIKILMARKGIDSQRELADLIGLSKNAVSDLLLGKRLPSLETVGALCKVLNCTPNDILVIDVPKVLALAGALA